MEAYTIKAFTEQFGFGKTRTYEMLNDGTLESVKIGRKRLIKGASARALLDKAA